MHRFFVTADTIRDNLIEIDKEQTHHIEKVLRLKNGDYLELFDGAGNEYICRIHGNRNGLILAEIEKHYFRANQPAVQVVLAQGIAKGEKMDYVIQKAVEIGVYAIIPFVSERTVVILNEQKARQKVSRWQNIAREACKQSGRNVIPEIKPIVKLPQLMNYVQDKRAVMLYEGEKNIGLRDILIKYKDSLNVQSLTVMVGPEGGFSPAETELAQNNNVILAGLGSRILRTETAGLVAASIILYAAGDLG
ncbi:MAG: 16S rRNA (uracil(1498)-N(3))-methyltransferase [Syntrophomonadaceae bacterium]|nr:16S rRNA (uracil(1498)-N(3))-methyltransferase [Syntrophomonadaceae bacterium]